jgi:prepilin-type N-terminal cleavage/methylation domain-containing protein
METSMKSVQKGFTLIELVVVIVILGILAAVALPKFIDLTNEALDASTAGVAGAISSSSAINYGAFVANSAKGVPIAGANVCVNATLNTILTPNNLLGTATNGTTYAATGTGNCTGAGGAGNAVSCTITGTKGSTVRSATASVVCTG